jgi:ABC-type anion transport system duplicated permease subunit
VAALLAPRSAACRPEPRLEHDDVGLGRLVFVVASEAITVANQTILLPGVGSYIATAIGERNLGAIGYALAGMLVVILLYDQLLFRPLLAGRANSPAISRAMRIMSAPGF